MQFRDRIKELRRVKAAELQSNPRNWRVHPPRQRKALETMLSEIGFAGALLARERHDGTLELIDGHLRAATTPNQEVPVLILDVDETEANKILATLDPLAAMAETDVDEFRRLLQTIDSEEEGLRDVLCQLEQHVSGDLPEHFLPARDESDQLIEKYQVLVDCNGEKEQSDLLIRLSQEGHQCRALIA